MACVVDTSAFYAYLVAGDRFNQETTELLADLVKKGERLISTSLVLGETLGLLQVRHGFQAAEVFMQKIHPVIVWRWVDQAMFSRMWPICKGRRLRGFTIVDASVVACMEEHPGATCIALDEDLKGFGFPLLPERTG